MYHRHTVVAVSRRDALPGVSQSPLSTTENAAQNDRKTMPIPRIIADQVGFVAGDEHRDCRFSLLVTFSPLGYQAISARYLTMRIPSADPENDYG